MAISITAVVPACYKMLLRGSCKWGSSCKYCHDAGVLAAARKFAVIDYLPAHAVLKKNWVGSDHSSQSLSLTSIMY